MTIPAKKKKPKKPFKDFPLFAHPNGQWAKKIRGRPHYFGVWAEPDAALDLYLKQKDYLLAGKPPPSEGHTILEILDRFIITKNRDVESGDLSERTFDDYMRNCKIIIDLAGNQILEEMGPEDFSALRAKLATGVSTTTLKNRIRMGRIALKYYEEITNKRLDWGKSFKEPSKRAQRKHREERGLMLHSKEEILSAIRKAPNPQVKAMILLGINCGFQNGDCSNLTWDKVDMQRGWHNFSRPKTYIPRKGKLWPETIKALELIRKERDLVFLTRYGKRWSSTSLAHEALDVGIKFSWLRKTFRTIADETRDPVACRIVMGHAAGNPGDALDDIYIQRVPESRLEAVSQIVHEWLFSPGSARCDSIG